MFSARSASIDAASTAATGHLQSDLHELLLTPHGTAYVTSYEMVPMNLSSVGGPVRGHVVEGIVQEVEVPSARVLWEWRSLEHVSIDESYMKKPGNPFDYFHTNSIDVASDGNLIASARNTWAVYKISRRTGAVLWRLGGKKSDFRMDRGRSSPAAESPILVRSSADGRLYASWNGATDVAAWQLLTGTATTSLEVTQTFPRQGFETPIAVPAGNAYAAVTALDAHGAALGTSAALSL